VRGALNEVTALGAEPGRWNGWSLRLHALGGGILVPAAQHLMLAQGRNGMTRLTSIYLDLTRFLAALTIFVVHANYDRFTGGLPFLWRLKNLGNDAVMVFFVLSGFVIAYVSDDREKTLPEYTISRLARLYSVVAPALLLTVLLDYVGSRVDYQVYNGWWFQTSGPFLRCLANMFFVNELWFLSVRPFSNGPFWSLGYEFWYYVLFAAWFYLRGRPRYCAATFVCFIMGPKILVLLPVWLLGVLAYRSAKMGRISEVAGWTLFVGSIIGYVSFRKAGCPKLLLDWTIAHLGSTFVKQRLFWSQYFLSSYIIGVLVAAHFLGLFRIAPRLAKILLPLESPIRYLAGYTFALYLLHYPLLQFFAALSSIVSNPRIQTCIVMVGTLLAVWALGTVTEKRKPMLKKWLRIAYAGLARKAPMEPGLTRASSGHE
jgi:peptidoglycan/LPS O-acetylase OafA/YrhL